MQTPWGEFKVSDAHMHFFSRRFFASLATQCHTSAEEVAGTLNWDLPPEDPLDGQCVYDLAERRSAEEHE